MDIAIGIQFANRELRLEMNEDADKLRSLLEEAFSSDQRLLWFTDSKGRQVAVPLDKLAYVEIDPKRTEKQVGFAARPQES